MADDKKRKYYDSLVQSGVVPPEVSYETFVSRVSGDKNYSDIVYSGLETASKLGVVEGIPDKKTFESVLRTFPTKPELKKDNFGRQVPDAGEVTTDESSVNITIPSSTPTAETEVVAEEVQTGGGSFPHPDNILYTDSGTKGTYINQPDGSYKRFDTPTTGGIGIPTNQPQVTPTGLPTMEALEQGVQPMGGQPVPGTDPLANAPQQDFQWSGQQPVQPVVQPQAGMPQTPEQGMQESGVGYMDYLGNAVQRGMNRGEIADYISATGKTPTPEEFSRIAELNAQNEKLTTSQAMQDFANNPDLESTLKSLPEIAIESIASLYRHGLARMGTGAVMGGVAGSVIPGAGTLAGAGTGLLSGMSVAGLGLEVSGTIMDGLNELKIDTKDPEALKTAFSNPSVIDYLRQKGYARGISIGVIDAFSFGLAGKLLGKPVSSAVGRGLQVLGEAGIQGGAGATGELVAQINSGEKIKGYEILAEGLAEIPGSIPEVGIAVLSKNKGAGKDTKTESARLAIKSPDMPIEAINEAIDVGVGTGEINATQATELKQEVAKAREIDTKIPAEIKDTELRVTAIGLIEERDNLNAQLETVDEAFKPAVKEKIKAINEQLQELSQIPQQQSTQAFFETNQPSQTNPLLRLPKSVDAVIDKIDQGILVSAESLYEVYNDVQTAIRETLANRAITPEERSATINILSGMLSDIDSANKTGQEFVEQVEAVSVQDRLPAVREGVKPLPQGQAPKGSVTPSIAQAKTIREENKKKQAGTNVLPSSGQNIVTPTPTTEAVTTETEVVPEGTIAETEVATETPQPQSEVTAENPALADVESTADDRLVDNAIENAKKQKTYDSIDAIPENNKNSIKKKIDFIKTILDEKEDAYNDFQGKVTSQFVVQGEARRRLQETLDRLSTEQVTETITPTTPPTPTAETVATATESTGQEGGEVTDEVVVGLQHTKSELEEIAKEEGIDNAIESFKKDLGVKESRLAELTKYEKGKLPSQKTKTKEIQSLEKRIDEVRKDVENLEKIKATQTKTETTATETPTLTPVNATDVETITKIENATEKGRELALNKPTNKGLKRAFETFEDLSARARKAGIYDGKTLKIGGQEIELDTPAKLKAFLANQGNFDALSEAVNKSEIEKLDIEFQELKNKFIRGMGTATMNLNPEQVSILSQMAWNRLEKIIKNLKLSSAGIASQIKKSVDNAVLEINQTLAQSGQTSLNPDKDDITNIINGVRKLAEGIVVPPSKNAGQIGTAGQPSATQSPVYTKEQEELARQMEKKMDEGKPFIARNEPFWTAVKRKTAELRQKLDSPKELLNFAEKMIGLTPGSSYNRTRELPLGRAMEQLRGKARSLALPYMERISGILKPIENNLPDFEKYLIYRRIIDRAIQDKLNQDAYNQGLLKKKPTRRTTGGMTETNADILLNDLRNKIGADLFDKFTQAGDELQQVFDDNLKDLVNAGVLTKDRYDAIKAQNEFYIPFDVVQRDFRGNVITGTEYDRTNAQGQSVVKKIKGIDTPKNAAEADGTIDTFYKMMQNGDIDVDSYYYLATEKITDARNAGNITQQEYESLMDSLSEPGLELHSPLNKTLNIINASQYQVARQGYMEDVDRLVEADTNNDYFKRLEDGEKLPSGMAIITYYKDGVQQRVAVDEKLKQAIDGMTKPELSAFGQVLKFASIPFKIAATSASVTFLPVNFVIDTVRTLTSKAGLGSGANITERVASVVQMPVLYSEALVESVIGNLLNTKLGNALGLKSITPELMYKQYEEWRKSPSYSEGTYMNYFTDKLKSGRTQNEIEDAQFLETVQRRTQTILGNPKTAKAISEAMLGAKQKTRLTVDGLIDIINIISKMLENSHKIYGNIKLSGSEAGVRRGLDTYIGGYIDKLHSRKRLTQSELENVLEEINDEILNNIGSPNFEQIPPNMRAASVMLPFFGAAVKGNMTDISRMMNAVNTGASKKERKDALVFSARNAAVFTIPAFMTGLAMALKSDDEEDKKMYDDMDENSKWKNMIIPIERGVDGEGIQTDFITIPIRGLPVIFNSIGRASGQAFGEAIKDKLSDEEVKKISKDLLTSSGSEIMTFNLADKTYLSNIDPETGERKENRKEEEWINRSMSAISGINPLIKYPLERIANKNFFGKYSLLPDNIRGKRLRNAIINEVVDPATGEPISPSVLKNKFTPEYSVTLSKKLEKNGIRMTPIAIDHFFDTFLAGAPEKFDVGASELMKRRFLWKERKLAYGQKPKTN